MDIVWRVFTILTDPVPNTFVCVNRRNNEVRAHIALWACTSLFCQFTHTNVWGPYGTGSVKMWKLATKYPWIYGYFLQCIGLFQLSCIVQPACVAARLCLTREDRQTDGQRIQ